MSVTEKVFVNKKIDLNIIILLSHNVIMVDFRIMIYFFINESNFNKDNLRMLIIFYVICCLW